MERVGKDGFGVAKVPEPLLHTYRSHRVAEEPSFYNRKRKNVVPPTGTVGTVEEVAGIVSRTAPAQVLAGVSLDMIGSVLFVLFVAGIWARLRSSEPPPAWLSVAATAAGILAVAFIYTALSAERGLIESPADLFSLG